MLKPLLLLIILFNAHILMGQQTISGKIYLSTTDSTLSGINVFNKNKKNSATSASGGQYTIAAAEGDTILFSGAGYENFLLLVEYHMLLIPQGVNMKGISRA